MKLSVLQTALQSLAERLEQLRVRIGHATLEEIFLSIVEEAQAA